MRPCSWGRHNAMLKGRYKYSCCTKTNMINSQLSKLKSTKGFKMANLNINSILNSIDQLRAIMVDIPFYILSINETKIDDSVPDNEISVAGYHLIRKDRNRPGAWGVLMYIRESIPFSERNDLVPTSLEMIFVEISRLHISKFLVQTA